MHIYRLGRGDEQRAQDLFSTMAAVFEEDCAPLTAAYLEQLLARPEFWAVAALDNDRVVAGITGYALPMTRSEQHELFIYDVAVRADRQRQGVGRALLHEVLALAAAQGIEVCFVPADNEDTHALDFYRALGASPQPATFFTFSRQQRGG